MYLNKFHYIDSCILNEHFEKIISGCYDKYSSFNIEQNSFDYYWFESLNSTQLNAKSFDANIYKSFQFTQASNLNSRSYTGSYNDYAGGGFVYKMKGSFKTILNETKLLKEMTWIDKQTAALFIEFTIYNPNLNNHKTGFSKYDSFIHFGP